MEEKIRCFYHAGDQDGICSAAIVLRRFPTATLHPIDYIDDLNKKVLDVVEKDDIVIMVDFNLRPISKLIKLNKQCKTFIWIDHHGDILKEAKDKGFHPLGIQQDGTAASVLTWKYFFDNIEVPLGVTLVGKNDIHQMDDDRVYYFKNGMDMYSLDPTLDIWQKILDDDKKIVDNVIESGKIIFNYERRKKLDKAKSYAFVVHLGDYTALAINGFVDLDDLVANNIFDPNQHDFLLMFVKLSNVWKISMRSLSTGADVSEIAKRFKGGGHIRAAGFEVKDDTFVAQMIKGKILIKQN
jgi:oligoribonuclease NrnB/cAMP/cGMP phosphodiesterase (DHH superfamily)